MFREARKCRVKERIIFHKASVGSSGGIPEMKSSARNKRIGLIGGGLQILLERSRICG